MPPSNTTLATAIDMASFPYANTQSDIHDAGTTFNVWYKHTSDGTEGIVGLMFRGAGGYTPTCEVYIDDDSTLLGTISANLMSQIPMLSGRLYGFKVVTNGGNPSPAVLTVSVVKQPRDGVAAGDIFIRAASILPSFQSAGYDGLGGGVVNPADGTIKDFDPEFQVGESGDYLSTGELCFADEFNSPFDKIRIYNPTLPLTLKATVTYDWRQSFPIIRTWREGLKFLVVDVGQAPAASNPVRFFTIDGNGVQSAVTDVTGVVGCTAAAMNVAGTKVYLSGIGGSANSQIRVWDIAGAAFDADLVGAVASHITKDILVMKNGELVVLYHDSSTDSIFARIYSSAGATIATYTVPIPASGFTSISPRLGYANDDSITFWIFPHGSDGFSYFKQVNVADGSEVLAFTTPDSTYFTIDQGATPAFRVATSDSCPFVLLLSVTPPTPSGIYKIVTNKRVDTLNTGDVAIPDPTFKTALMP